MADELDAHELTRGDPCIVEYDDDDTFEAVFWEDLGGHVDVLIDGNKVCIIHGTVRRRGET